MDELKDYISTTPSAKHWEKIGLYPHHGIILPLFSLRSEKSSGIGEYLDLIKVIDWCADIGFDVIQLLPLNETNLDPSPYNALSSCALNPVHLSLHALDGINENKYLKQKLKSFSIFSTYQRYPYLQIRKLKMDFLYEYYHYIFNDLKSDKSFQNFLTNNSWLEEYALFRTLLDKQGLKPWYLWPEEFQKINETNIAKYIKIHHEDMHLYYALQYFCYKQLSQIKKYAEQKNVFLLGDIPILVSKNSHDVWFNKSIFDNNYIAGAPPDAYSIYGQKWGFPIFNWNKLKETNYHWWTRRLKTYVNYYHIYRIDHLVGFFRIWSMQEHEDAMEGRFFPRDPAIWNKNGNERLTMMLNSSELLPVAEDLGLIPKMVYKSLRNLGICGTKVIPWERNIFGNYIKFQHYEPLSMTTLSTHDSDTFQQWWQNTPNHAVKFAKFKNWSYKSLLSHHQRKELLRDAHNTSSVFHLNLLQEYLALYPKLIWPKSDDERINDPRPPIKATNWTYRFRPSFDTILDHKNLNDDLKEILS